MTLTYSGSLPGGVTFDDNGDGTATLSGAPDDGSAGTYDLTITASDGVDPDATQDFVLTVTEDLAITSDASTTFVIGESGAFDVTTSGGDPSIPTTFNETGTLPGGVTFTDEGDGTAVLGGTPTAGSAGTYDLTITASNGVDPDSTQDFVLTIAEGLTITSADTTSFVVGQAGAFEVSTAGSSSETLVLTYGGTLPDGVSFTDNGDGTATLSGTPADASEGHTT